MRRLHIILLALLIVAGITGCKNTEDDVLHLGLNAIIVEINHEKQLIYVSDTEHEDVFGGRAAIDCSKAIERDSIFYVDYPPQKSRLYQWSVAFYDIPLL